MHATEIPTTAEIASMSLECAKANPEEIAPWRELYRHEMHCQIIHDSWLGRGWTDTYRLSRDGRPVGYALVGAVRDQPRVTVTEFYVLPDHRPIAKSLFRELLAVSQATTIETQTNDRLLTLMLFDFANEIERHAVLFEDGVTTQLHVEGALFRRVEPSDRERFFPHHVEPEGDWVIEADDQIVASGGILFHYNLPYGDIYMEVVESQRRRGFGCYLVQELKRVCYEMGRIPAARCNATNAASRATLEKAGMIACARMLVGNIVETP